MKQRDELKTKRRNRRKRRKTALLVFLLLVAVGLLFGLSVTVFFPIKHIEVQGSSFYTAETVAEATEIKVKDNLLLVNEEKILSKVQNKLPFVDNIKITRKFPDTLKITVTDASELYCYKINEIYYSSDKKGRVLKEYTEKPDGLIYVEAEAKISAEKIKKITHSDENVQKVIDAVSNTADSFPFKADYIDLTDIHSVKLSFDNRLTAELGDTSYINEKLQLLITMMESKTENDSGTFRLDMWTPENHKGSYFENGN